MNNPPNGPNAGTTQNIHAAPPQAHHAPLIVAGGQIHAHANGHRCNGASRLFSRPEAEHVDGVFSGFNISRDS
ncbi:hypothetical protein M408DRAFT_20468 [Serendipita vermifera MAFF 305830]|uniref:Uncharacterized protein n=1 Tax=Serendipita vermifera MAFF 305830 TaxID=933852 RepID=A0A0C2X1J8_SERVB|nr:hypothetical protein M408DRAFT_20468 [Serendipita vermifera MAFF 305830]